MNPIRTSTEPNERTAAEPVDRPRIARSGVDVMDAIYGRRAVRSYTERKVDAELVRELLHAATQAPSAVNAQPWAFAVVQRREWLELVSDRAKVLTLASLKPGTPQWARRDVYSDPKFNVFYDAGTLIAICAATGDWHVNEDCALAAENLMLAAHGLGLATCPIGLAREALNEPKAKEDLGIPADFTVVMPIIVGYPRERPVPPPRREPRVFGWK